MTIRNSYLHTTRRAAVAVAAGAALTLGVAACSETEDAANDATSAAGSVADDATSAAGSAADEMNSSESGMPDGAEMVEAKTADGQSVQLPKDIDAAWENAGRESGEFGALKSVDEKDGKTLASFDKGWMTYSKETGAVPLIGKIGETWADEGALDSELGLPTAPEEGNAMSGWTQMFQNGKITWADDGNGEYSANVEKM
ncbi:LGFP repeat-containing protein [Corynebacterium heidelbergense]|uniref:LGFP repeat-containing protein n=1 Tax=Corynebacterium heidelbergense TaxID=2055947 RepID=A0A364V9V6_9CORY|nr:hypothetical protein [Corynebacterium heidelbergense]RAV33453.1 hypothetical protein CWC39_08440 [Corynebacterium heidelbergense]WCZ37059.1 LGFP repeat protein [Corynebacterium heidelbergense]